MLSSHWEMIWLCLEDSIESRRVIMGAWFKHIGNGAMYKYGVAWGPTPDNARFCLSVGISVGKPVTEVCTLFWLEWGVLEYYFLLRYGLLRLYYGCIWLVFF